MKEVKTSTEQVQPLPPIETDVRHITVVYDSRVNEKTLHIACVPKTSAKACWTQMTMTKKSMLLTLSYMGRAPRLSFSLDYGEEHMQLFFCADDIERCVKGSCRKWVISYSNTLERPLIPTIWPIKIGTNLTCSKIEALENVSFQLL